MLQRSVRPFVLIALYSVPLFASADTGVQATQHTETRQTRLTATERASAEVWSLSEQEWQRYRDLLRGIRGSVSPANLSPIEVLGIHARDAAERRQYAERWAKAMREDADRILAFQRAYDEANQRLFSNQPLIDPAKLFAGEPRIFSLDPSDQVLIRMSMECPACDELVKKALKRLDAVAGIAIEFVKTNDTSKQAIERWARRIGIRSAWVHQNRVTLTVIDEPAKGHEEDELPWLRVKRGESIQRLAYMAL